MDASPICHLPQDTLHMIFSTLPLRQIMICRSVCKFFNQTLTSSSFINFISTHRRSLSLLALRPSHHHSHHRHLHSYPSFHVFDVTSNKWIRFDLSFLPFRSVSPVTSSLGVVYLWGGSSELDNSLVVCNPDS
ncbi:hypothetical protein Nepgr_024118 [Nepenthes gracilis]|uniref:F-box domain-containing protein n=1 Tax=Nepenthes gracilis TaxID=150966 RepID=A0AAD3XZR2_NEPGR|nr:hypothetical protein Nepgr_024118 [Nepenthes gracilis]